MIIRKNESYDYLALNEKVKLLKEDDRAVICTNNNVMLPINLTTGGILSLFNGKRTLSDITEMVQQIFNITDKEAQVYTKSIVQRFNVFFTKDIKHSNENCNIDSRLFFKTKTNYDLPEHYPAPVVMNFNLTFNCNRKCKYCYMDATHSNEIEQDRISTERLIKVINEAADLGVTKMVFIGGEPFLHPDIIQILKACSDRRINAQITTKYYISDEMLDELAGLNNLELVLSYDINKEEICNELIGSENFYNEMESTLRGAVKRNINVIVAPVLCSKNVAGFVEYIKYLIELGVKDIYVCRFFRSVGRYSEDLEVTNDQWNKIKTEVKDFTSIVRFKDESVNPIIDTFKGKNFGLKKKRCAQGRTDMTILPDGRVSYCGFLIKMDKYLCYGDLRKNSILEIWNSKELEKVINPSREQYKGELCYDCANFKECNEKMKCVNCSMIYKNKLFAPVKNGCGRYKKNVV